MQKATLKEFKKKYFDGLKDSEIPKGLAKAHYEIYLKSGMSLEKWIKEG